jgi:hypothetical protein
VFTCEISLSGVGTLSLKSDTMAVAAPHALNFRPLRCWLRPTQNARVSDIPDLRARSVERGRVHVGLVPERRSGQCAIGRRSTRSEARLRMLRPKRVVRVPRVRYSGRFAVYRPLHNEPPMRSRSFRTRLATALITAPRQGWRPITPRAHCHHPFRRTHGSSDN